MKSSIHFKQFCATAILAGLMALAVSAPANAREHFFVGIGGPGYYAYPAPYPYYPYAYPAYPAPVAAYPPGYAPPPPGYAPAPGYPPPPGYGYPAPAYR